MLTFREIKTTEPEARMCADMVREYSWGMDYPVDPWEEMKQAEYIIGCFDQDKLVACASVTAVASPDGIDNGKPWLADAVVLPQYRRHGIGKILYEKLLEHVKNDDIVFICTDNPIVEESFLQNGWTLNRITHDESGDLCKIFTINPKLHGNFT